jgi:dihydrofolate reductase
VSISLIWAQSTNGVIGRDGALPWHLPEDMARFRSLTTGATVVMGRATWESLPERFRPLPGRRNVVLSRRPSYDAPGARVAASLTDALDMAGGDTADGDTADGDTGGDVWVIGGAAVYAAALPHADALFVTDVAGDFEGDVHAPELGPEWVEVEAGEWQTSSTGLRYRFRELHRDVSGRARGEIPPTP